MTGTAMTEDKEFKEIYNLDVVTIPTNLPVIRKDNNDIIYKTEDSKFKAVIEEIKDAHEKGQPVLVGTASIENSEKISKLLKKEGLKHEVLNAKNHEKEAEIVAQAGKYGAITIATNMAGRGTDIMLGGNSEFLAIEEMRRKGRTEAEIAEATAYNDTDDEYILELEVSNSFDDNLKESMQRSLFSFFVMNITSKWYIFTNKNEAESYATSAATDMEDVMRKAYYKKKPVRPIYD